MLSEPNIKLLSSKGMIAFFVFWNKTVRLKNCKTGETEKKTVTTVERWTFVAFAVATRRMLRIGKSEHRSGGFLRSFAVAAGPFMFDKDEFFWVRKYPKK